MPSELTTKRGDVGMESNIIEQHFHVTDLGYSIEADARLLNKDLLMTLTGGNIPHIGGVLTYDGKTGQTKRIYFASHDGRRHKDMLLADRFFNTIHDDLPGNLCLTAGVHLDGITAAQIKASFLMTDDLAKQVKQWLHNHRNDFQEPLYTTHL